MNRKIFKKPAYFYIKGIIGLILLLTFLLMGSVLLLRWVNPSVTSFMLREDWTEFENERYNLREFWVEYENIPEHLVWAVIASEDQRFREHFGIDWAAVDQALDERRRGEGDRGASTITQQVAKNIYLWPAQSYFRKAIEAVFAIMIEIFWTKDRILEVYLNIAEFGPGIYGVGKASGHFYGLAASELIPEQSSRLATVLPSPKRMRVEPPSPFVETRSQWVLRQMTQLSGIQYIPEVVTDTIDLDPLLWDLDIDFELETDTAAIPGPSDTLHWDDPPDSLLQIDIY